MTKTVTFRPTMETVDFKQFYLSLPEKQRAAFAKAAKTTPGYISTHLIHARRAPRKRLMNNLIVACSRFDGPTRDELFTFFYSPSEEKTRGAA